EPRASARGVRPRGGRCRAEGGVRRRGRSPPEHVSRRPRARKLRRCRGLEPPSSRDSPDRMARFWPSCCWRRGTASPAWGGANWDDRLGCWEHLRERVELVRGDLLEPSSLRAAIRGSRPREIYHLAAPSFVPASWELPWETISAIAGSAAAILEEVRGLDEGTRVFLSASGAIFGEAPESPQREDTPCRPVTPYAIAKLAAHELVGALRTRHPP